MSNEHKDHASKDSLEAMHENDARSRGSQDAVPGDDTAHAHSHAAHEAGEKAHTKPTGDQRTLIVDKEEVNHRFDRGHANNRGVGAGLRGDSGTRGQ